MFDLGWQRDAGHSDSDMREQPVAGAAASESLLWRIDDVCDDDARVDV